MVATTTVSELMRRGLVSCPPETRLGEAAAILVRERVHALVVADESRRPAGVLADSDLLAGEWLADDVQSLETMRSFTVGELMSTPVATIPADTSAGEAADRMLRERVSRLVVVDEAGAGAGVVTVSDLVGVLAEPPAERRVVADVMSRGFVACRPETSVGSLARAMTERRSRSVVVLDARGKALGVVTGHDLLPRLAGEASGSTAGDLMHPPLTIGPDEPLRAAADRLVRREVHRLVVVDDADPDASPLGIVSTWDVLAEMARPGSVWRPQA